MRPRRFAKVAKVFLPLLWLVNLFLLPAPARVAAEGILPAEMQNYCAEPPFAAAGIKSNLLLMLDNSASMYDPAYTNPATYCLDDTYDNAKTYSGYFEPTSIYQYDPGAMRFVPGAQLPAPPCSSASCAASTSYLYLEMAAAVPPATHRTVGSFRASGNFLNWLSMSKLDLQKRVLTGGKFVPDAGSSTTGVLQAETRGCQGKRFVKMVQGIDVTFVVRGPMLEDIGFTYDTSRGGGTIIDVYDGLYQKEACLSAIRTWIAAGDKETLITQANACMKAEMEPGIAAATMPSAGMLFSRIMGDCYDPLVRDVPLAFDNALTVLCMQRYVGLFGVNFSLLQLNSVDGICGKNVKHTPSSSGSVTGFIGRCVTNLRGYNSNACILNQMTDYCNEIRTPYLTDPSSTANRTGTNASIPSYILDAGVYYLGKASGTFNARVFVESPPVGLVQQFANSINFGAMVFNANGAAGSECGAEKLVCVKHCSLKPNLECFGDPDCTAVSGGSCVAGTDGGRIISYINDPASPTGDHSSGLVAAIDGIKAGTWTPYAEAFYNAIGYFAHRGDLRVASTDFDLSKPDPSQYSCQKNNILIISDGMSTADSNAEVEALASLYAAGREGVTGRDGSTPVFLGSRSLDDLAWIAAHRNVRSFSKTAASSEPPATQDQSITTHVIFTGVSNGAPGEADPLTLMRRTAESGRGAFATASDPEALREQLLMVLRQVARGTSSGTDASIQSGSGNGAIFLQERYFPEKRFDGDTQASWIGEMQGLWYYIDPFIGNSSGGGSSLREDTVNDLRLDLSDDRMLLFGDGAVSAFYDRNGDGNSDGSIATISEDEVIALWRAGRQLWSRNLVTTPRTIYTPLLPGGTQAGSSGLMRFSFQAPDHSSVLRPYLQAGDAAEAQKLIRYIHGFDFPGDSSMRSRTVRIGNIPAAAVSSDPANQYVTNPRDKGIGVWKLGDIISSSAKVQSQTSLSSYDLPQPKGYGDDSYRSFIGSNQYKERGMIYVGANDGMLHAFRLGRLRAGTGRVQAVLDDSQATPGEEAWAFIPRNALPYLTYLKEPAYQHLYFVDGAVTLVDASIGDTASGSCVAASYWSCVKPPRVVFENGTEKGNLDPALNTWRTVLIGSMGLGGASRDTCSAAPDPAGTGAPCVPTPIADPADSAERIGYSSYFALDVTNPEQPTLLWEFSHPELGYSTTGPAIVRVGDPGLNGRWFAVFGSGPTGPIVDQQFLGQSNRDLKFFVVDLRSGQLVTTITTGITNAFAGSMSGGAIDDRWTGDFLVNGTETERELYQDDAIYVGYTALDPTARTWTRGGVGRIMIAELADAAQPTDSSVRGIWQWSRVTGFHQTDAPSDRTGPITTGVVRLQDRRFKNLWLYFGSGRYFYRSLQQDDFSGRRAIYGVKEPCYTNRGAGFLDKNCTDSVCGATSDCLTNQTEAITAVDEGWRIDLDPAQGALGAERVIANPVSMTGGAVFFPTFQPSSSACRIGNSYLWGVRYDTGGAIPAGWLHGKVLTQLSGGQLRETVPSGLSEKGNRRGPVMLDGKPGGIKIVTNSGLKPLKKVIHIQER